MNWLKRDPASFSCFGSDPDRNYDVDEEKYGAYSACSETYAGPKSLSEPETKSLASFLEDNKHSINVC